MADPEANGPPPGPTVPTGPTPPGTVRLANRGGLAELVADAELEKVLSPQAPPPASGRMLRVEVRGLLHDWFDVADMGDFIRSPQFAGTLRENVARYFGVPVERQAIYDEDGLLTNCADFSRALQRLYPKLFIYDLEEMGPELRARAVEELRQLDADVEQSWRQFGAGRDRGDRGISPARNQEETKREWPPSGSQSGPIVVEAKEHGWSTWSTSAARTHGVHSTVPSSVPSSVLWSTPVGTASPRMLPPRSAQPLLRSAVEAAPQPLTPRSAVEVVPQIFTPRSAVEIAQPLTPRSAVEIAPQALTPRRVTDMTPQPLTPRTLASASSHTRLLSNVGSISRLPLTVPPSRPELAVGSRIAHAGRIVAPTPSTHQAWLITSTRSQTPPPHPGPIAVETCRHGAGAPRLTLGLGGLPPPPGISLSLKSDLPRLATVSPRVLRFA